MRVNTPSYLLFTRSVFRLPKTQTVDSLHPLQFHAPTTVRAPNTPLQIEGDRTLLFISLMIAFRLPKMQTVDQFAGSKLEQRSCCLVTIARRVEYMDVRNTPFTRSKLVTRDEVLVCRNNSNNLVSSTSLLNTLRTYENTGLNASFPGSQSPAC